MAVVLEIQREEVELTPVNRAKARDTYIREFERNFRQWTEIAACCLAVKRDEDWKLLGFSSFTLWLVDAAPVSQRYLFLVMGIYEDLIEDIPEERLAKIPLGSGVILHRQVKSRKLRRDPRILEAATAKPKHFTAQLRELAPEQHAEGVVRRAIDFTQSQYDFVNSVYEQYQAVGGGGWAEFIEFLCTEVAEGLDVNRNDKERKNDPLGPRVQ